MDANLTRTIPAGGSYSEKAEDIPGNICSLANVETGPKQISTGIGLAYHWWYVICTRSMIKLTLEELDRMRPE